MPKFASITPATIAVGVHKLRSKTVDVIMCINFHQHRTALIVTVLHHMMVATNKMDCQLINV